MKIAEDKNEEMNLDGQDSDNEIEQKRQPVKLPGKSGTYQEAVTIHERYASRPKSATPNLEGLKIYVLHSLLPHTPIPKICLRRLK